MGIATKISTLLGRDDRTGSALARIDELSARVAESDDPALEAELVRLRHRAFSELPVEAGPAPGRPAPEPLEFERLDGIPIIGPADLRTSVAAAAIERHGCLLVRGLVGTEPAERLREGIDAAFAARESGAESPWHSTLRVGGANLERQRWWVSRADGLWTADSPRMVRRLVELLASTGLYALAGEYLGGRPVASVNKWTLRKVSPAPEADWHQDGAFLGAGIRALNIWITLTACGRDAPGLEIVPRRLDRILEPGTEGARFDWSVSPHSVATLLGDGSAARPELDAGDVILFDQMLLHQTANSAEMTRDRYAIETWCFSPSSYPAGQVPLVL